MDVNPSRIDTDVQITTLTIINELSRTSDESVVVYRPVFKRMTGSTNAALLLSQMFYRFQSMNYEPFYKFKEPCSHERYREGDSWCEELGFTRKEFDNAVKKIGTKVTSGMRKKDVYADAVVVYWTDADRVTWYDINLVNLAKTVVDHSPDKAKVPLGLYLERLQRALTDKSTFGTLADNEPNGLYPYTETTTETTSENTTEDVVDAVHRPHRGVPPQQPHSSSPVYSGTGDPADLSSLEGTEEERGGGGEPPKAVPLSQLKQRELQKRKRALPVRSSDVEGRGEAGSSRIELDDERMPAVGKEFLLLQQEIQKQIAEKPGPKTVNSSKNLGQSLTKNQVDQLRQSLEYNKTTLRSLEELYDLYPALIKEWFGGRILERAVKHGVSSTAKLFQWLLKPSAKYVGVVSFLEGKSLGWQLYLPADAAIQQTNKVVSVPYAQPEEDDSSVYDDADKWMASLEAAMEYLKYAYMDSYLPRRRAIEAYILEQTGWDAGQWMYDPEAPEPPEHLRDLAEDILKHT